MNIISAGPGPDEAASFPAAAPPGLTAAPTVVPTVVIVGGGLAGLAAAVRLARNGCRPVVLEKRPFLGGRAFSFTDPETGVEVDNGQHVFVGACTEYQQFLKDIGAWDGVRVPKRLNAPVLRDRAVARLRGAEQLPGPLGNLPAVMGYTHLSFADRLRVLYGLGRMKFARRLPGGPLEYETFDAWLRRHGQNGRTIRCFWDLIVLPALNDGIATVSADAGLMLFQTALLGAPGNAAIGYPVTGLSSLAGEPARQAIEKAGGEVRPGVEAERLEVSDGRVAGVRLAGGGTVRGDAYVVALPAAALLSVLPEELSGEGFFAPARGIETSPIVGVHIWYDRPVINDRFIAVLDSPVQWVFNVTALHEGRDGGEGGGQHVAISLSGAWQWRDMGKGELREVFVSEMARLFPAAAQATVTRFMVVKMLDATFRSRPGAAKHRLPQRTPVQGLFLAGDWTITGWPSTMESAVRSGNLAAEAVSAYLRARLAATAGRG